MNPYTYVPLWLATNLLDAPVPDGVLKRLIPLTFDRRLTSAARSVVLDHPLSASLRSDFSDLRWGTSVARRVAVVAKVLYADVVADRYGLPRGSARIWWRYPQRVAYLCRSYGGELWRFLRQGRTAISLAKGRDQLTQFLQIPEARE